MKHLAVGILIVLSTFLMSCTVDSETHELQQGYTDQEVEVMIDEKLDTLMNDLSSYIALPQKRYSQDADKNANEAAMMDCVIRWYDDNVSNTDRKLIAIGPSNTSESGEPLLEALEYRSLLNDNVSESLSTYTSVHMVMFSLQYSDGEWEVIEYIDTF